MRRISAEAKKRTYFFDITTEKGLRRKFCFLRKPFLLL